MSVFNELQARGMIAQITHEEEIKRLLEQEKVTFYIGFDPTADSLHVGHFLQMMVMAHMQKAGHRPIVILGSGTAMIGDPTGKSDMRKMMTLETLAHNASCFQRQMEGLIDFSDGKAIMLNNADWIMEYKYIDFLRDIGVHFSVNRMLTAECFKSRLERGLNFIEFNYMLLQSYDFLKLYQDQNCILQLGGDDQWSNILGGIDLVRRVEGKEVYGMTFALLTTGDGKKMGKTESGAVWLDPEKTSPYDFFQYWRNVDDADVIRCLKMLTFVPVEEIEQLAKLEGSQLNQVKERLAFEVTKIIHGQAKAQEALDSARALFGAGGASENMPSTSLVNDDFTDGSIGITDLLVKTGLAPSKGEARRLIQQGGISVNDVKMGDFNERIKKEQIAETIIIKKGKKVYHKVNA